MKYDSGDPVGCLDRALVAADWAGFAKRKAESAQRGKYRGIGLVHLRRSLRPGAVPYRDPAGRARRPVRERDRARASDRSRDRAHGHAQSRSGPRDDVRPDPVASARHSGRQRRDRIRRHRQGAVRSGHLRFALGRGRRLGAGQSGREGHRQGQEDRRSHARGERHRHRVRDGIFTVAGTDQQEDLRRSRAVGSLPGELSARDAGAGARRAGVLRPGELHVPVRCAHRRGRDRPGNRDRASC